MKSLLVCGKVICAWCKKVLSDAPNLKKDTHTICPECRDRMMKDIESSKKKP